jgi:hypothetical protein
MQHSEEHNEHAVSLLRLPGEIRNHIYGYVFEESVLRFVSRPPTRARLLGIKLHGPAPLASTLSSVCRKLRRETMLLPFSMSVVSCQSLLVCAKLALLLTKPQHQAMTSIRIEISLNIPNTIKFSLEQTKTMCFVFSEVFPSVKKVAFNDIPASIVAHKYLPSRSSEEKRAHYTKQTVALLNAWLQDGRNEELGSIEVKWEPIFA